MGGEDPIDYVRWGWVFLERTRILSGIQFTTHFIDFVVVKTKLFVSSNANVILTRQLLPELEQGCQRQTPSASILFFHTNLLYVFVCMYVYTWMHVCMYVCIITVRVCVCVCVCVRESACVCVYMCVCVSVFVFVIILV